MNKQNYIDKDFSFAITNGPKDILITACYCGFRTFNPFNQSRFSDELLKKDHD